MSVIIRFLTCVRKTLALKQDFNRSNPLCEPFRLIEKIKQKITNEVRNCYSLLFHALFKAKNINVYELSSFLQNVRDRYVLLL